MAWNSAKQARNLKCEVLIYMALEGDQVDLEKLSVEKSDDIS